MSESSELNAKRITLMAEDLDFIADNAMSGIKTSNLRQITAAMRRITDEGELLRVWRLSGHEKQPIINAVHMDCSYFDKDSFGVVGGAKDHNPSKSYVPLVNATPSETAEVLKNAPNILFTDYSVLFETMDEDGDITTLIPSTCFQANTWTKKSLPVQIITEKDMRLTEYLDSTALYYLNKKVKRSEIVQYVSYYLGGVHGLGKGKMNEELVGYLNKFSEVQTENRNLLFYVFQSIAQDLIKSRDVQKLMTTVLPESYKQKKYATYHQVSISGQPPTHLE